MTGLGVLITAGLGVAIVLIIVIVRLLWVLFHDPEGRHAESSDSGYTSWGEMPPEIAHEEYIQAGTPWDLPAPDPVASHPAAAVEQLSPDGMLPPPPVTDVPLAAGQEDPAAAVPTASAPPPVTSPIGAARAATQAVRAMPLHGYLAQLAGATAWEDRPPFGDWERDSIVMAAIQDGA